MPGEGTKPATIGQRLGFDGKLVRVRVDEIRLPSGRIATREVVEHPGAVAIVAVTDDDPLLLVHQYRHAVGEALLEIPAGTLEPGEPPAETARRELIEETGYAPGQLAEIVSFFPTPGYSSERIVLFHATGCHPVEHTRPEDEPAELVRLPLADLSRLLAPGPEQIRDGKSLIGLLWLATQVAQ